METTPDLKIFLDAIVREVFGAFCYVSPEVFHRKDVAPHSFLSEVHEPGVSYFVQSHDVNMHIERYAANESRFVFQIEYQNLPSSAVSQIANHVPLQNVVVSYGKKINGVFSNFKDFGTGLVQVLQASKAAITLKAETDEKLKTDLEATVKQYLK